MTESTFERSQEAHRAAFALITAAIQDPLGFDPESTLTAYANDGHDPIQTLLDIAHALVWHAAGALIAKTDGDPEAALEIVQAGALAQELKEP